VKKLLLIFSLFASQAFAQADPILGNYQIHGIIKTKAGERIPGATLYVRKGGVQRSFAADIDGNFVMGLQPGEYVITASSTTSPEFKAFLKIIDQGLNPDNVEFVFDPSSVCCQDPTGKPYPKPLVLPRPPYPPAARAVRASGEVVVKVKIDKDGKVTSAEAENGHPLLRRAAEAAARSSTFEAIEIEERVAKLTYVFVSGGDEKKNVPKYKTIYRIEVIGEPIVIDTTTVR
jgi:TonB family protein